MADAVRTNVAFRLGTGLSLNAPVINGAFTNSRFLTTVGSFYSQTFYANTTAIAITSPATTTYTMALFVDDASNPQTCVVQYPWNIGGSNYTVVASFKQGCPYVTSFFGTAISTLVITQTVTGTTQVRMFLWSN